MAEKKSATEQVRPVSDASTDIEGVFSDPNWTPGYISRFPWLGLSALSTVLLCAAASVVTLEISDGKSQSNWPEKLAPNVILGGLNSLANIMFGIAIGNGIAIAWWRRTLKGATIEELHRSWAFSSSLKEIALSGKYFNFIALAALTTKLTIVDNMLLQRATTTTIAPDEPKTIPSVYGYANDTIPVTGRMNQRGEPALLNYWTSSLLGQWSNSGGLLPTDWFGF